MSTTESGPLNIGDKVTFEFRGSPLEATISEWYAEETALRGWSYHYDAQWTDEKGLKRGVKVWMRKGRVVRL